MLLRELRTGDAGGLCESGRDRGSAGGGDADNGERAARRAVRVQIHVRVDAERVGRGVGAATGRQTAGRRHRSWF